MYGRNISSVCCPFVVVVCVVHATKKNKKTTLILNGVLSLLYSCTKTKNEINVAFAFITTVFEPMTALIERELNGSGGVGEGEVRGVTTPSSDLRFFKFNQQCCGLYILLF